MRPLALDPKHRHISGSPSGGGRAAIIYTLIGSASLTARDPQADFRVLLDRLAGHPINRLGVLMPWHLRP